MNTFYKDFKKQAQLKDVVADSVNASAGSVGLGTLGLAIGAAINAFTAPAASAASAAGTQLALAFAPTASAAGTQIALSFAPAAIAPAAGTATTVGTLPFILATSLAALPVGKVGYDLYRADRLKKNAPFVNSNVISATDVLNTQTDAENEILLNKFRSSPLEIQATFENTFPGITDYANGIKKFERTQNVVFETNTDGERVRKIVNLNPDEITKNKRDAFVAESLKTLAGAGLGGLAGNYISDAIFDGEYKLPSIIAGVLGGGYLGNKW